MLPDKLHRKLGMRHFSGNLRGLQLPNSNLVDFSSNDYLGFARTIEVEGVFKSGATGSRLISGHSQLHEKVEQQIANFHKAESALIFNSGYDANLGLISCLADRADLIIYDSLVHASMRDGIRLSHAKAIKFPHNDLQHLEILLDKFCIAEDREVYVVTESVFSMDGDQPDLQSMIEIISKYENVHLILDEAHALGVLGDRGEGLAQSLGLEHKIFARVMTFGKALGAHGAAVLGSEDLKQYLVNFSRSFIYTTALPEHSLRAIEAGYDKLVSNRNLVPQLREIISYFNDQVLENGLRLRFRDPDSYRDETAIQICKISGNSEVTQAAQELQANGYDIRAMRSPTVSRGQERLRICLHVYNTKHEIQNMLKLLAKILKG
ncbi:8-amino-7-oxononanoate synthase [Nonlabens spongiae]|uniref:8-amino-7-oxononanoate synthase n=1 Tax=Nonlabens spongiae TaxID=331648 RepID=A0A1W6MKJ6_9FLAO|nr:pyridoxal phosphate-dependent aminotransferase family protein [Nonlabens spongiae]ARN78103.1 8-amino-7-oxononanoate synthase [Nonlabens spongiae]